VTITCRRVLRHALTSLVAGLIAPLAFAAGESAVPVRVVVTPKLKLGPIIPIWNGFGYDEPNYTYLPNGQSLLASLAEMGPAPVYVRAHHMFSSGDGSPALKWGSTGMYREDAQGNPVYDFTIADRIVDTWVKLGLKPFMELGFMPEALSSKPEKYPRNPKPNDIVWFGSGFSAPPKDYQKWGDLCHAWAKHCVERHGRAEVATAHFDNSQDDQAQIRSEREIEFALNEHELAELQAIEDALKRIEAGVYGLCLTCGAPIPHERLQAAPQALRCVGCQTTFEAPYAN
jgi:xylan 1,4-beta-xylosidase